MSQVPAKLDTTRDMLAKMKPRFAQLLYGNDAKAERFVRVLQNAVSRNHKLLNCDPATLCDAAMKACEFDLEPNTPANLSYIIPYGNVATLQLGYPGLQKLAWRAARIMCDPQIRYANDRFKIRYGLDKTLEHEPAEGDRGEAVGYYCVFTVHAEGEKLKDFYYMTRAQVEEHRDKFSKDYQQKKASGRLSSCTWHTSFNPMALKTVLILGLKYLPKAVEDKDDILERAIQSDMESDAIPTTAVEIPSVEVPEASAEEVEPEEEPKPEPKKQTKAAAKPKPAPKQEEEPEPTPPPEWADDDAGPAPEEAPEGLIEFQDVIDLADAKKCSKKYWDQLVEQHSPLEPNPQLMSQESLAAIKAAIEKM